MALALWGFSPGVPVSLGPAAHSHSLFNYVLDNPEQYNISKEENPKLYAFMHPTGSPQNNTLAMPLRKPAAPAEWGGEYHVELDETTEHEELKLFDGIVGTTPSVVMFFAGGLFRGGDQENAAREKAMKLKPMLIKASVRLNEKFFSKGTRPLVRFVMIDTVKHRKIRDAYGVNDNEDDVSKNPVIRYYPGQGLDSRSQAQGLFEDEQSLLIGSDNAPHQEILEDWVRDAHMHAWPAPVTHHRIGPNLTREELIWWEKVPANCDGDECNGMACPEGTTKTIVMTGYTGTGPHGECNCRCFT